MMFVQTVLASQNVSAAAAADNVHAMSSLDLADVMDDFSQMNVGSVVVACLLMVCTRSPFLPVCMLHWHMSRGAGGPPD